jgi:hypothetical protein
MKKLSLSSLLVLNLALLGVLAWVSLPEQSAEAQIGAGRADYTMIAAQRSGRTANTIYVVDMAGGGMLSLDPTAQGRLEATGFRIISGDFEEARQGR